MPKEPIAGDFTPAYRTYRDRLFKFIRSRTALLEDAEDILQEVFYQLARMDSLAKPLEQIDAWLYRVARNKIIDHRKKKKAAQLSVFYDEDEILADIAGIVFGAAETPETEHLRAMIFEEIQAALDDLPEEQRDVFEQTEFLRLSVKEVAERTNTPPNTVLSRKHYAVVYLRKRLKDLYADIITHGR
ncbi:MAG: sigma-70 family RNA polymerase sigma factor [Spirochaetaceae bacterium]|jgi:RNA polymerase sigma factor (sigma-70 family)|nr:sigma-70 family RNA polymerase sigma factor [Spirochaetaceae bacterium]